MTMAKPPDGPKKVNSNTQTTHKCKLVPSEFGIYQEEKMNLTKEQVIEEAQRFNIMLPAK